MAKLIELGGGPVNPTEREIVQRLVAGLPEKWRVIPNASLPDPRTGHAYEYDAIVVAPHAVYVVEVKGWRGTIRALSQADWQIGAGKFEKNPLPLADNKARVLATLLRKVDYGALGRPPYVQAALVCGDDASTFEVFGLDQRRCLLPSQLVPFLLDPARLSSQGPQGDYGAHIDAMTRAIAGRLEARQGARRFGSYQAESLQSADDESAVWLGWHAVFDDGRTYRIRTWFLSAYRYTPEQREARLAQLRRSAEALHRIGDHPNIATLRDFGEQGGEFYEVTDGSEAGTLETAFVRGALSRMPLERRLTILADIANGLAAAFRQGVLHRSMDPEHVLLGPDGHARIIDFDRAFLMENAGTVYGALPAPSPVYVPPELRDPADYEVFDSSDLYSLGKLGLRLLGDDLPPAVRDLLLRAASDAPEDRPADPRAFREALAAALAPAEPPRPTPPPTSGEPQPGDLLDGANRVIEVIGRGAGSVVYRVHNETLGEDLALKLFTAPDADSAAEFRLLRGLSSPHAVRAVWSGRLPGADGRPGLPFLLLEHLPGDTLRQILARGPVPADQALDQADQLLDVLEQLHPAALHRDIKPDNVVITPRGAVLVDFGAAAPAERAGSAPVGTLRYTPPDLATAGWSPQADLFAVGAVLFELLAGVPPWGEAAPSEVPPAWERLPEGITPALRAVLERALAPSSALRPPSAAALRAELRAARLNTRERPPRTVPHLSETLAAAAEQVWSAGRVQALIRHPDLRAPLFQALAACVVPPVTDAPEDWEAAVLATEARALALERPLAAILQSAYDRLIELAPPVAADATEDAEPAASLDFPDDARLVVIDGLHPVEWSLLGLHNVRYVWTAGPTEPGESAESLSALSQVLRSAPRPFGLASLDIAEALASGSRALILILPRGSRDVESLGELFARRASVLRDVLSAARLNPGPLWVTTTWGGVYLGHGLRQDLGEGLGAQADAARAEGARVFGARRVVTEPSLPLRASSPRPSLVASGRRFVVGRLSWPDPPGTPWLHAGGLSLPERLLPLFVL